VQADFAATAIQARVHPPAFAHIRYHSARTTDIDVSERNFEETIERALLATSADAPIPSCLAGDTALEQSVRANTPENARLTFDHVVNDLMQDMIEGHFKFYKQVNDDQQFSKFLFDWLFDRFLGRTKPPSSAAS
jgi:hypothetical protein